MTSGCLSLYIWPPPLFAAFLLFTLYLFPPSLSVSQLSRPLFLVCRFIPLFVPTAVSDTQREQNLHISRLSLFLSPSQSLCQQMFPLILLPEKVCFWRGKIEWDRAKETSRETETDGQRTAGVERSNG